MSEVHWFDQYRQYVADVVFSGLRFPQYENRSINAIVASLLTLIPDAQQLGLCYKDDLIMNDPVYMVAELFMKTRDGWELTMEVAVKQEDFVEYENFVELMATTLKKLSRSAPKGEMVQYLPTGETLRGYLDHCEKTSPWKITLKASDFLYSTDQVDLREMAKQHEATQDTYNTPIHVKM